MKKFLAVTTAITSLVVLAAPALAVPLSGTFAVTVWHGTSSANAALQALPSAISPIVASSGSSTTNFAYTGSLSFSASVNTIAAFFASGNGTITGGAPQNAVLSTGGFADETLIRFTFTVPTAISGTITHDDGASLFLSGQTGAGQDLLPVSASAPTAAVATSYSIAPGTYDLYYSEVNGLPATLNVVVAPASVPEPVSMALLGTGLLGLGMARRRTRRA